MKLVTMHTTFFWTFKFEVFMRHLKRDSLDIEVWNLKMSELKV